MSVKIEKVENGMATLTVTVPAADFNKAITSAYNRTKSRFNIPGFRKGKASQYIIEKCTDRASSMRMLPMNA